MTVSHFTAALFFALFISTVFGITGRNTDRERLLYGIWVFALFVCITVGAAWFMYFVRP